MSSLIKKIVSIGYDIFEKQFTERVVLPEETDELIGGSIEVSLLQEFVKVMDDPVDTFSHNDKTYTKDQEYASRTMNVYVSDSDKVFILHHPTDSSNLEDILTDVALALNFRTQRVTDEVYNHISAERKYLKKGMNNIRTIGYSLGAFISEDTVRAGSQATEVFLISRPITFLNFRYALPSNVFSIKSMLDPVGLLSLFIDAGSVEGEIKLKPEVKSVRDFIREHLADKILERLKALGVTQVGSILETKSPLAKEYIEEEPIGGRLGLKLKNIEEARKAKQQAKQPKVVKSDEEKMTVFQLRTEIGVLKKTLSIPRSDFLVTGKHKGELIGILNDLRSIKADAE